MNAIGTILSRSVFSIDVLLIGSHYRYGGGEAKFRRNPQKPRWVGAGRTRGAQPWRSGGAPVALPPLPHAIRRSVARSAIRSRHARRAAARAREERHGPHR